MSERVGISFDLMGTLLAVRRSPGYQYGLDLYRLLERKGLRTAPMKEDELQASFKRSIKLEISRTREPWVRSGSECAEVIPLGGLTAEDVLNFWYRVVDGTFDSGGRFCSHDTVVMSAVAGMRNNEEWQGFIESVLRRFATPEPYHWLPRALPVLRALKQWRQFEIPLGVHCDPPALVSNTDARLERVINEMLEVEGDADLLGELLFANDIGASKPSPRGITAAAERLGVTSMQRWIHVGDDEEDRQAARRAGCNFLHCSSTDGPVWFDLLAKLQEMIRKDLDIVPVVQPKHRIEEDRRLAAERRQRTATAAAAAPPQVVRYALASGGAADSESGEIRLFSVGAFPGADAHCLKTLHVLEASRGTWMNATRSIYRGVIHRTDLPEDDGNDASEELQFSSLPLSGYRSKSCFLLTLPETTGDDVGVASLKVLNTPIHALCQERAGAVKDGDGISASWYSGLDVRKVQFKRSYIDDDFAEEDDKGGYSSDDEKPTKQRNTKLGGNKGSEGPLYKKSKVEGSSANNRGNSNDDVIPVSNIQNDGKLTSSTTGEESCGAVTKGDASPSLVSIATLSEAERHSNVVNGPDLSMISRGDLKGLVDSFLKHWAEAGKTAVPLSEVAKTVLKLHPLYVEMKAKHLSPETRKEAIDWFRESQTAVRNHIYDLGYAMDSTNNVYLSRKSTT